MHPTDGLLRFRVEVPGRARLRTAAERAADALAPRVTVGEPAETEVAVFADEIVLVMKAPVPPRDGALARWAAKIQVRSGSTLNVLDDYETVLSRWAKARAATLLPGLRDPKTR